MAGRTGRNRISSDRRRHSFEGAEQALSQQGEETPYERLLGDAMIGDRPLFTREDAVEAAWAVVDPVLKNHPRAHPYKLGGWGPKEANRLIASDGSWHNPKPKEASE